LLRVLLENDDQLEWVAAHLDVAWLPTPDAREIISQRLRLGHDWPGAAAWLSQPDNIRWQSLVSEILADSRPLPNPVALVQGSPTIEGIVKRLRDKYIDRQLAEMNRRRPPDDSPEALLREWKAGWEHLYQLKKHPLAPMSDQ
jgi:hypothetical protein